MTLTLNGTISAVEDISTDQTIAHRLSLTPYGGPDLTCISFDYQMSFGEFIGKRVQIKAFLDEVPVPEERFNQRELIATRIDLADHMDHQHPAIPSPHTPYQIAC